MLIKLDVTTNGEKLLVDCAEQFGGLPVLQCIAGSAAAAGGIRVGDIILEVNGFPITGPESYAMARERNAEIMQMKVRRGPETIRLTIQLASSRVPAVNARGSFLS